MFKTPGQFKFLNGQPAKYQLSFVQLSTEAVLATGAELTTRFPLSHAQASHYCFLADTKMNSVEVNIPDGVQSLPQSSVEIRHVLINVPGCTIK